ncbi:MAG: heterodisulfide reductase-related iron-sulfur binding cluster [bacterium]|jgi:Fe-S oxidoreductase|nr:(Fe-S)-binding protein [Betaproteobacteria bacterium]
MSEKVVFWYGCNVVRHGDIIHSSIEILRAIGLEVAPVGGPSYCCGTSKDANLRAADGMAKRTVGKFNDLAIRLAEGGPPPADGTGAAASGAPAPAEPLAAAKVVTWCPSCHRHMNQFMGEYTDPQFPMSHFTQVVHAQRERLRERLVHRVERRVVLHRHFGFREVDVNPLVEDLLRLIPGLELVDSDVSVPGHMCSALVSVPAALKDVTRGVCDLAREAGADTVATVFHSCQRVLCGLEATEPFKVVNYVSLLGEAMGLSLVDEYKEWKLAGSADAVLERIGADRVEELGEAFVREQLMPELLRAPAK